MIKISRVCVCVYYVESPRLISICLCSVKYIRTRIYRTGKIDLDRGSYCATLRAFPGFTVDCFFFYISCAIYMPENFRLFGELIFGRQITCIYVADDFIVRNHQCKIERKELVFYFRIKSVKRTLITFPGLEISYLIYAQA